MRGKSVALLVLALGCGLIAALGITQILAHRATDVAAPETVPVMVAASEIGPFMVVTNEMVKSEEWPKDRVPPGAIIRTEDIVGRYTKGRVYGGELLIEPKLLTRGEHPIDSAIPKGLRVVTVAVEVVSTNGGLVLPNSRVDLQLHVKKGQDPNIGETMTQTILQDVRVFAVNDITTADNPDKGKDRVNSIQGRTVSLLVTPQQAGIVTAASELGTIRMIMRSADDREQPKISIVTPRGLLGVNDGADRSKEDKNNDKKDGFEEMYRQLQDDLKKAASQKSAEPEPTRWAVKVINAGNVSDVVLQTFDNPEDAVWTSKGLPVHERPAPPPQGQMPGLPSGAPNGAGANGANAPPASSAAPNTSAGKNDLFHPSSPSP